MQSIIDYSIILIAFFALANVRNEICELTESRTDGVLILIGWFEQVFQSVKTNIKSFSHDNRLIHSYTIVEQTVCCL